MRILFISLIIVIIDQLSKIYIKGLSIPFLGISHKGMLPGDKMPILSDWLNITFVENPGIAFGMDFGGDYKLLISLFTIAATVVLFSYLFYVRGKNFATRLSYSLIIGGAVGNLIDRTFYGVFYGYAPLLYGKVVDFIDIRMINFAFFNQTFGNYILNFADIAVTAGVIVLLASYKSQKDNAMELVQPAANILVETEE